MAGFTFTQSTKLLLKNLDKASPDEIHDMIDKEFEDKTLADKFLEAKIDGPCFLRLSQEEKNDLLPGICNMMARRWLTDMIDYAKAEIHDGAGEASLRRELPQSSFQTPTRRRAQSSPRRPTTPARTQRSMSETRVVGSPSANLLAQAQMGAQLAAQAVARGQISPGQPLPPPPAPPAPPRPPPPPPIPVDQIPISNIEKFTTEAVEFNLFTDPELESHRLLVPLPKSDRNRLTRQTISAMRVKTMRLRMPREPERSELMEMAQALCLRYPGLRDAEHPEKMWGLCARYLQEAFFKQLLRRQQNVTPVKRPQGLVPQRSRTRAHQHDDDDDEDDEGDHPDDDDDQEVPAPASRKCTAAVAALDDDDDEESEMSDVIPLNRKDQDQEEEEAESRGNDDIDDNSREQMAKHYDKLVLFWAKKKPSIPKIKILLLGEKPARRDYIDNSDIGKLEDKVAHVLEKYPMFVEPDLLIFETALILAMSDDKMEEVQADAAQEIESIYAYGLKTKKITSAAGGGKAMEKFSLVMQNLASIFPAKKKKRSKDDILVVCDDGQDFIKFVKSCIFPRVIICNKEVILAAGAKEISSFPKPKNMQGWGKILLTFLSVFYAFTLPYPQGYDVGLLVLQAIVLEDKIHKDDRTAEFTKAIAKYKEFTRD